MAIESQKQFKRNPDLRYHGGMRTALFSLVLATTIHAADPKWDHAIFFSDCAPHDGPATAVVLVTKHSSKPRENFPQFAVNYWGAERPSETTKKGTKIRWKSGEESSAAYCPKAKGCERVSTWGFELQMEGDGDGTLTFEFLTPLGKKQSGKVPLKAVRGHTAICG